MSKFRILENGPFPQIVQFNWLAFAAASSTGKKIMKGCFIGFRRVKFFYGQYINDVKYQFVMTFYILTCLSGFDKFSNLFCLLKKIFRTL